MNVWFAVFDHGRDRMLDGRALPIEATVFISIFIKIFPAPVTLREVAS